MFDAHVHFPMKSKYPFDELRRELIESGVKDFLLILNSMAEVELFVENFTRFKDSDLNPRIAIILNIHDNKYLELFNKISQFNIKYSVKIHPKLSDIKKEDFPRVDECLSKLQYETIIVDNWFFGPRLLNNIGLELAIFLAENHSDKKIVIAHSGGVKVLETMLATRPINNIYYDLSVTCTYFEGTSVAIDLEHFIKYTSKRIAFGSDYPDFHILESYNSLNAHCENVATLSSTDMERIFEGNAHYLYD